MPLALSLHSLVSSVGADAGFAAVIGLAILVLVYFAHARETATLRDRAEVLSEQLQQAEAKLAQIRRGQVPAAPAAGAAPVPPQVVPPPVAAPARAAQARPAVATPAAARAAATVTPGAPAGVAAPALAAATRFIAHASSALAAPSLPTPAPAQPEPPVPAPAQPESPTSARPQAPASAQPESPTSARPRPAMAATREGEPPPAAVPAPATAAGAHNGARDRGSAARPPEISEPSLLPRRVAIRPTQRPASRSRLLPPQPPPRRPSPGGRRLAAAVAALIVVGVVAGLLIATSGGGSNPAPAGTSLPSNAPTIEPASVAPAFNPGSVTVAVLNGTSTNNLAHTVGTRLVAAGYKQGALATASDQTLTRTVVAYRPGHRDAASHVAASLKLGPSSVVPVDSSTQAIACPAPNPCNVQVIVTVGSDLATH